MSYPQKEFISIIVPAKDEENRLPVLLNRLISYCQSSYHQYEIIVVDDGSADATLKTAQEFQKYLPSLKVISCKKNRGKGYAVKTGFWQAKGDIILFLDADGSTPPEEIEKNLAYFEEGYDIVIGSRIISDSQHVVKAKFYRMLMGRIYNAMVHLFLFKDIQDPQCGFKMFRQVIVRPLFSRMNINGFGFDSEILYVAHLLGLKIKEVPVNWQHVDGSKINLIRESWKMLVNIFQVRSWHLAPIHREHQFMSVEEIASMAEMEEKHWWFQSKKALILSIMKKLNQRFSRILDAGCGTGLNMSYLKDFGCCFGCDVASASLTFCQKNGLKNLIRCNLERPPFKDQQFECITILDVLEHAEDPEAVLRELSRILKNQGIMIVTVPAFKFLWSHHDEALSHLRRYQKEELKELLENHGFEVDKIGYFFFSTFLITFSIRFFKKIFCRQRIFKCDTFKLQSKWINDFLKNVLNQEIKLMDLLDLPFGTTLYAIIHKSKDQARLTQIRIEENSLELVARST